jgi:hypothetical protein
MKKTLVIALSMAGLSTAVYGQGAMKFNNLNGTGNIKIGTPTAAGEGTVGNYVGSSYKVALYYSTSVISGAVDPTTLTLYSQSTVAFYGVGASESSQANGAGFFDGNNTALVGPGIPGVTDGQTIYVEAVAYWGADSSYSAARTAGHNTGYSAAIPVRMATGTDNTLGDMSALAPFTVGVVPEPTTIALGGLGAAALLLFRRRK